MMKIVMFISKGLLTTVLTMTFLTNSFSQGFKVKEFKQIINDGSAFHAPMDEDGHPCGLIKVRTDDASLKFKGNVIGEVENKTNEYWVYIPQGSQSLLIMHPNFLPLSVDFSAYGVAIVPKATYVLTLSEQKFKKEKCGLIVIVKPETSCLYINDSLVENLSGNGFYQLYLPKGNHICRIEQKGYRPNVQAIAPGKGTQTLNVELESVMAELTVKCKTATAEIYVDGELKGNGQWSGSVIPGEHQIEAKHNNYESMYQTIFLSEKEKKMLSIRELKRSICQIRIETKPYNVAVILDGKDIGQSPCVVDVETGEHYVTYNGYGLNPVRSGFKVESGALQTITLELQYKDEYYMKAYNGDLDAILRMATEKNLGRDYEESVFWMERFPHREMVLKNWWSSSYWNDNNDVYGSWRCNWILAYSEAGMPEKAVDLLPYFNADAQIRNTGSVSYDDKELLSYIGNGFLKKKDVDKAKMYLEKAGEEGYEGLGDYYVIKGNKQLAANYYNKYLKFINSIHYEGKSRVLRKIKEIGY